MKKKPFDRLTEVVAILRGENGCPWDREQTHDSLKPNLIEEAYELIDAIDSGDKSKISEELGDLLLQVMLHSQIASENGDFDVDQIIETLTEKLIRRHPHVFGDLKVDDTDQVLKNWEAIKRSESRNADRKSVLDGIPNHLPNLQKAQKLQIRASRVGFDWDHVSDVLPKLREEINEIEESIENDQIDEIEMEIGDLLFATVNLCRFLRVRAEEALRRSNQKFVDRFHRMESELDRRGEKFSDYDLEGLDQIWELAKSEEK